MGKRETQTLEEEHHLIQEVVSVMAALAERLDEGQAAEKKTLANLVGYMRVFVDNQHYCPAQSKHDLFTL